MVTLSDKGPPKVMRFWKKRTESMNKSCKWWKIQRGPWEKPLKAPPLQLTQFAIPEKQAYRFVSAKEKQINIILMK